ncbi:MAG: glycosyltransferase [Acidiphilium sp. 20-67-58]|nr:MAG: glycosyltransferase [Acidiphilium sp. 20-67-58]
MDQNMTAAADGPEALFAAGLSAHGNGDYSAAARCFTGVLEAMPGFPAALANRALSLWSLGALDDAERDAVAACTAMPGLAEGWMVAGAIRIERGDSAGAIAAYSEATRLRQDFAPAQAGLAAAYLAHADNAAATRHAALALILDSTCNHARFTLGSALSALGKTDTAISLFTQVLAAEPRHAGALLNRGNALVGLDRIEQAEADLRAALAIDPNLREALASLAVQRTIQGDTAEAIALCDRAIALDPDFAVAQWNRGVAALLAGDFATGFEAYEWRKRHPIYGPHFDHLPAPVWTGDDLAGRHLLVRAEQGLGDTIMFARFLPRLIAEARRVTLACQATLFPLFAGLGVGLCRLEDPAPADVDCAIDQMSLPHVLRLTPETIPAAGGYLAAPPAAVERFADLARPAGTRLFGLVWAGNPGHNNDRRRSLPTGVLAPLIESPGLRFIALQLGARQGEYDVPSMAGEMDDFGATAGILHHLDGLVTVDTSVAHLAGAMGKPCHVLLSASCDWRWLLGRSDTPWYSSIRLHRQQTLGDWSRPIDAVLAALRG